MKDIIVMCPTVDRANCEFKEFLHNYEQYIEKSQLRKIKLKNGKHIFFKGETEGEQAVRGFRGDILWIDDFLEFNFEDLCL